MYSKVRYIHDHLGVVWKGMQLPPISADSQLTELICTDGSSSIISVFSVLSFSLLLCIHDKVSLIQDWMLDWAEVKSLGGANKVGLTVLDPYQNQGKLVLNEACSSVSSVHTNMKGKTSEKVDTKLVFNAQLTRVVISGWFRKGGLERGIVSDHCFYCKNKCKLETKVPNYCVYQVQLQDYKPIQFLNIT